MGYIRHKALLVQGYDFDGSMKAAHDEITKLYDSAKDEFVSSFAQLVGPILTSMTNGYQSFMIAPDGSKEGWTTSDTGDILMDQAIAILEKHDCDYAVVLMGGDDGEYKVLQHSGYEDADIG